MEAVCPVKGSPSEGVVEAPRPRLENKLDRASGEALYLPGLLAGADLCEQSWVIAEAEGHHPDLYLAWRKCKLEICPHKIKGLTESDFVLAAKAERKFKPFHTPA